ncbi:DUF998 domain-containing protein [Kineococcus sp. SYSU DK003]|uniref:DUF998 domain-containing protein n=1 Tax=Kineococcus sp. SYSU DK003 TaxID=3383124 RepID=UPI003D7C7FC4
MIPTAVVAAPTAALMLTRLGLLAALHVVPSDYSPVRHAVSDYAVGRTRRLSTAMTWVGATAWAGLAATVAIALPGWEHRTSVTLWLLLLALVFTLLPHLPTDLEGAPRTRTGVLHHVAAITWFAISYSLTGTFRDLFTGSALGGALGVLHLVAAASLTCLVLSLPVRPLRARTFGLSERVFLVSIAISYLLVTSGLLTGATGR